MPSNIFGDRFMGVREPAWHKIGTVIPEPVPVLEAFTMAGIDYEVVKAPLYANLGTIESPDIMAVPKQYATIRQPHTYQGVTNDRAVLGVVSEDYHVLQNSELAAMLEPLNDKWAIETVGALGDGEVAWLMLDVGDYEVNGEKCKHYLLVSTGHDGSHAVAVALVKVRVVCWNTYTWALNSATMKFNIPHKANVKQETKFALDIISGVEKQITTSVKVEQKMGATKITDDDAKDLIAAAYPMPKQPRKLQVSNAAASESITKEQVQVILQSGGEVREKWERQKERTETLRNAAFGMYGGINTKYPEIANTAWAGWQAITEVSNWREGPNADQSIFFGVRNQEMARGLKAVADLVGV